MVRKVLALNKDRLDPRRDKAVEITIVSEAVESRQEEHHLLQVTDRKVRLEEVIWDKANLVKAHPFIPPL
jgi:hypothetical protein